VENGAHLGDVAELVVRDLPPLVRRDFDVRRCLVFPLPAHA
jgi:hypothetical protein